MEEGEEEWEEGRRSSSGVLLAPGAGGREERSKAPLAGRVGGGPGLGGHGLICDLQVCLQWAKHVL